MPEEPNDQLENGTDETSMPRPGELIAATRVVLTEAITSRSVVFRNLIKRHARGEFDGFLITESSLIKLLGPMLEDANHVLAVKPPSLVALEKAHSRVQAHGVDYLRESLEAQRSACLYWLNDYKVAKSGKELSKVRNGLCRRSKEATAMISSARTPDEEIASEVLTSAIRRIGRLKPGGVGKSDKDVVFARAREIYAERQRKIADRSGELVEEIERLMDKESVLTVRVTIGENIKSVLAQIEDELRALPPRPPEQEDTDEADEVGGGGNQRKSEVPRSEPRGKRGARLYRQSQGANEESRMAMVDVHALLTGDVDVNSSASLLDQTITRLNEVMDIARAVGSNKIRILTPVHVGRVSERFHENWTGLFNHLGFDGEIEMVGYSLLKTTMDVDVPVIIPRGMNTHTNKWDKDRLENTFVLDVSSPGVLISYLRNHHRAAG